MNLEGIAESLQKSEPTETVLKEAFSQLGISVPRGAIISEIPDQLNLDFPLVLKVSNEKILHKTEIGGVVTAIRNIEELNSEFSKMKSRFPDSKFLLEEMIENGLEIIAGIVKDKDFGLSIMVGMGGIYTELYEDVAFRLLPIDVKDATEMIEEVSIRKFTGKGFRGTVVDKESLVNFLIKLSDIGMAFKNFVQQLDLNPVKINKKEIYILDAKLIKTRGY